jgi:hypothetical protein
MTCGSREERRVTAWWPEKLGVIPASGLMGTRAPEIGPACVRASTTLLNGSEEHRPARWTSARGNDQAMSQSRTEARSAHGSSPYQRAALSAPPELAVYAVICGKRSLARTPAPDAVAIASQLGSSDALDQALADFAELYADQNKLDYTVVKAGRVKAETRVITRGRANTIPPTGRSAQPDSRFLP